jgi:hypothetical protein
VTSRQDRPLRARRLRELRLAPRAAPARPWLSAASALVRTTSTLCVVADDELSLGWMPLRGTSPMQLLPLLPGMLPSPRAGRKRSKPDFEILLALPRVLACASYLLALGSGATPRRRRGALVPVDARGQVHGPAIPVDAAPLYGELQARIGALNLEGAFFRSGSFHLLQRGHRGAPNAVISLDAATLLSGLRRDRALPAIAPSRVVEMDLGGIDGVPLCFTDACALADGGWLYSAVAEDAPDAIADGAFLGAVIGCIGAEGQRRWQRRVDPAWKIEGIDARPRGESLSVLAVADADDASKPAWLLSIST